MVDYYDLVLGVIPLAILGIGGGLQVVGLASTTAIAAGGLVAVVLVLHALFVRAPISRPEPTPEPGRTPPPDTGGGGPVQPAD